MKEACVLPKYQLFYPALAPGRWYRFSARPRDISRYAIHSRPIFSRRCDSVVRLSVIVSAPGSGLDGLQNVRAIDVPLASALPAPPRKVFECASIWRISVTIF